MRTIIDQRSNIYDLVHEARYYMIFFLTKPWDVHHFSCTPQVFLPLLHTALPKHVLHVLSTQETHTKHTEHLLPPLQQLLTLVQVEKLCGPKPKFFTLQFQEVGTKIFQNNLMMLTVDSQFLLRLRSYQFLQNNGIDVCEDIFVILVFMSLRRFFNFLFPLLFKWLVFFHSHRKKDGMRMRRIFVNLMKLIQGSGGLVDAEIILCFPDYSRVFGLVSLHLGVKQCVLILKWDVVDTELDVKGALDRRFILFVEIVKRIRLKVFTVVPLVQVIRRHHLYVYIIIIDPRSSPGLNAVFESALLQKIESGAISKVNKNKCGSYGLYYFGKTIE